MSLQTQGSSSLALYGNTLLRAAVRRNLVTFPAQIPVFMKPPAGNLQRRAVQLYFVRGWSVRKICNRYGLAKKIVQNLLSDWRIRAISAGLIQEIQEEDLNRLALEHELNEKEGHFPDSQSAPDFYPSAHAMKEDSTPAASKLMMALREDCIEFGVQLSRDQMRRIERVVRDITRPGASPPGNFPDTMNSGGHLGTGGFDSQPFAGRSV